jgi:hypothetical protein
MWVWVDAKGVTHYSDRPVPGAKLISIATMEPEADAKPATPRPPPTSSTTTARAPQSTVQYQLLEIFQPAENETFFNADAVVTVRIRSEPELVSGDLMRLYLDGNLVEGDSTALEYTLPGLERGAHSLRAQIVDAQGKAVYDMIYRPAETELLRRARAAGGRAVNGLGMLLYQGAKALELWSGLEAPVQKMHQALERNVYGEQK